MSLFFHMPPKKLKCRKGFFPSLFLTLVLVALGSCSSPQTQNEGQKVWLGSISGHYDASTKTFSHLMTSPGLSARALGSSDSILRTNGYVTVTDCAPGNWNGATKVLSLNYQINNDISSPTIVAPLELRFKDFSSAAYLIDEINTDLADQACGNPLRLSNCDSSPADGFFDSVAPYDSDTTDDPGHSFNLLMGGDNVLSPGESTTCKFLQFKLSVVGSFGFNADIYGKLQGAGIPAPSVGALASPTQTQTQSVVVALDSPADTAKIIGGVGPVTCKDGDPCDGDASVNGSVTVSYDLSLNTVNSLSVFQQDTDPVTTVESSATVFDITHDSLSPVFTGSTPSNGAIHISTAASVIASFNEALDPASLTSTAVLLNRDGGSGDCSSLGAAVGQVTDLPNPTEIRVDPTGTLNQNVTYCVTLVGDDGTCGDGNEVYDLAGNCLASDQVIAFTTLNTDSTPPIILSVVPNDGANAVSINTPIQVTFNEAMSASTLTGAGQITVVGAMTGSIAGTTTVSTNGLVATFTPTANLPTTEQFTVTVDSSVEDISGNQLGANYVTTFTTSAAADTTNPNIVGFLPQDTAINVSEFVQPQITFDEPMDPATINTTNIHLEIKSDGTNIPGSVSLSADGLTATFTPLNALTSLETYLLSVEFYCQDLAGNTLATPQTAEFTIQGGSDTTGPEITLTTPADGAGDISQYTGLVVAFNEPIDPNSVHTGTFYLEDMTTTPPTSVPGTVAVATDRLSATFTQQSAPLTKNQEYRFTVLGGTGGCSLCVKDLGGNPLGTTKEVTFNTEFKDNYGAEVIAVAPGDNTGTPEPINISTFFTFSEPILASSISSNSVLVQDQATQTSVPGRLTLLPDGITVKFAPDNDLATNTTYETVTTTAVKDLSGRAASAFTGTFDTNSSTDSTGPVLLSSTPADGSTTFERWENLEFAFDDTMDPSTINSNELELVRLSDSSKVTVLYSISPDGKSAILNPVRLLDSDEDYYVNIKTGLRNISGFPLTSFTRVDFQTVDTSSDATAPVVSTLDPLDGATGVARDKVITITLSEAVDPDTIVPGNITVTALGGSNPPPKGDILITFDQINRNVITITPLTDFKNKTTYEIRILDVIVDDANNALDCGNSGANAGGCDAPQNPTDWVATFKT